jgi:hemerythrin-like domain-containing protein
MNIHNTDPLGPRAAPHHGCGCSGGNTHPVDVLSEEHQTILSVLGAVEGELRAVRDGGPLRTPFWANVLDFLEHYADRCHHGKEEDLLFPELERAGLPGEHGPTACMRQEHVIGRRGRQAMAKALKGADAQGLVTAAAGYVDLLRDHIDKEDQVLFPMSKSVLDQAAVARLRAGFAKVEREDMGEGTHCRYEDLAREIVAAAAPGRA